MKREREEAWAREKEKKNTEEKTYERRHVKMGKPLPSVCGSVTGGFWVSGWYCTGLAWLMYAGGTLRACGSGAVSSVLPHSTHSPTQKILSLPRICQIPLNNINVFHPYI